MAPIIVEPPPAAILHLVRHRHCKHDQVVRAVPRHLALAHVAPHGDVEQHRHVPQRPRPRGHGALHDRPAVNVPNHAPLAAAAAGLIPRKVVLHGAAVHVRDARAQHAVPVALVVLAPVQAAVVLAVAVPRLGNVNLAVRRPRKRLPRQQPKGRPDALGAGGEEHGREDAAVVRERLPADEARRGVLLVAVAGRIVGHGADDQSAVLRAGFFTSQDELFFF